MSVPSWRRWWCGVPLFWVVALLGVLPGVALPGGPVAAGAAEPRWVAPLDGPLDVVRGFEPPATRWGPGHRGVDLRAFDGAVVGAAGAGTVTYAGTLAGRGVVTVTHGALRTTYEPVDPLVTEGEPVSAGEPIAWLEPGHAGAESPDAVLHWGLLRGETYLDPLLLLGRGPSRLVPVAAASPPALLAPPVAPVPLGAPPRGAPASGAAVASRARAAGGVAAALGAVAWVTRRRRSGASPRPPP